uniref:Fibrinogen C-terminal domain-containing protein n=1 Tax=Sinocyclocheilus grahami TaxID=75366 RepID=A0A672Q6I3_SINGR
KHLQLVLKGNSRVDLEDFEGRKGFALYSSFSVDPEADGYKLHVSGFTDGGAGDSLSGHNGYKFSTFDKDQDTYENNCAKLYLGAFWYAACYNTNPNGVYLWGEDPIINAIGNVWYSWKSNYPYLSAHHVTFVFFSGLWDIKSQL